jgi:hypothetical protein
MEVSVTQQTVGEGSRYKVLFSAGVSLASDLLEEDTANPYPLVLERLTSINETQCSPPKSTIEISNLAYQCIKAASKFLGDERDLKRGVLDRLLVHFDVFEEVYGTHWSGRRIRIDAIIKPKDDSLWKTKSPSIGLEFKNFRGFNPSIDMKDYTKWWSQCHDYAETNFDGHGYVYVFSYNGFSHYRGRSSNSTVAAFSERFWGRLGVGEIAPGFAGFPRRPCLTMRINGTNKIWNEIEGVRDGRRMSMERKFGSR